MKEIFEAMLGVFFVAVMMIGSSSVISTSIDAQNADATMQAYVTEVEHSNFSDQVLEAIFEQADADGGSYCAYINGTCLGTFFALF